MVISFALVEIKFSMHCKACSYFFKNYEFGHLNLMFSESVCQSLNWITTMENTFETNSSFQVKLGTTGKVKFLFFTRFLPVLKKEDGALGYNSIKFWDFPDIYYFP